MNPVIHSEKHLSIVYDADRIPVPDAHLFDAKYWQKSGAVSGHASGRGTALLLDTPFGAAVLRPYLRGGWPAKFSYDRYFYTGTSRSRPFNEFHLLEKLKEFGLPVPAPFAASCERGLVSYRGALLMEQIRDAAPLQALLGIAGSYSPVWGKTGKCIRQFHDVGLHHADLNGANILVGSQTNKIWLVDFDRCALNPGMAVEGGSNLARLKRSLLKNWPGDSPDTLTACWQSLLEGYHG